MVVKQSHKVLNKELIEFVGFKHYNDGWYLNDKLECKTLPDLINDLNAQEKYLCSKLASMGKWRVEIMKREDADAWSVYLSIELTFGMCWEHPSGNSFNKSKSLAFALAFREFIDEYKEALDKFKFPPYYERY